MIKLVYFCSFLNATDVLERDSEALTFRQNELFIFSLHVLVCLPEVDFVFSIVSLCKLECFDVLEGLVFLLHRPLQIRLVKNLYLPLSQKNSLFGFFYEEEFFEELAEDVEVYFRSSLDAYLSEYLHLIFLYERNLEVLAEQ